MKSVVLEPISARKWQVKIGRKIIRTGNFGCCLSFALKNLEEIALLKNEIRNEYPDRTRILSLR
jgi:hypothetical protein